MAFTKQIYLKVLVEHEHSITAVAISEDGKHVLTGDISGLAIIWSFKDGKNTSENNRSYLYIIL